MAGKKRRRPVHFHVMVSEEEQALIQERMAQMGAYMRRMALCGYVLQPCPRMGASIPPAGLLRLVGASV